MQTLTRRHQDWLSVSRGALALSKLWGLTLICFPQTMLLILHVWYIARFGKSFKKRIILLQTSPWTSASGINMGSSDSMQFYPTATPAPAWPAARLCRLSHWLDLDSPAVSSPLWTHQRNQNLHWNNVIFQGIMVAIPIPGPLECVPAMAGAMEGALRYLQLKSFWDSTKCQRLVFKEKTTKDINNAIPNPALGMTSRQSQQGVQILVCGQSTRLRSQSRFEPTRPAGCCSQLEAASQATLGTNESLIPNFNICKWAQERKGMGRIRTAGWTWQRGLWRNNHTAFNEHFSHACMHVFILEAKNLQHRSEK